MHLWGDGSRDVIELGTDNFTGLPLMLHKGTEAAVRRQNECESDKGRMELERYIRERGRCVFFNLHHIVDEARVGEMVLAAALRAVEKENIVRYDGFVMTKGTGGQALFTRGTVVVHTVEDVQELFQVLATSGHKPSLVQKKYEDQVQRKAPGQAEDGEDEAGGASRGSHAGSFGCSQASVRRCKSAF